jgi:hypothetical protein
MQSRHRDLDYFPDNLLSDIMLLDLTVGGSAL